MMSFLNKKLILISNADYASLLVSRFKKHYCTSFKNHSFNGINNTIGVIKSDFWTQSCNKYLKMEFINQVINGYIMSDGYVSLLGSLCVHHSSKQEKFVEWLYEVLREYRTDHPIVKLERLHSRTNKVYSSSRFNTKNNMKEYRDLWYKSYLDESGKVCYRKILPDSIESFFGPVFITLWFAGDGTKILSHRGAKFEVTCFTAMERIRLQKLFKSKFDIETSINRAGISKKGTVQWTLNIKAKDYSKFHSLVTQIDLIPKLFPHKLWVSN